MILIDFCRFVVASRNNFNITIVFMSDLRIADKTILLYDKSKKSVKIELFLSTQWKDKGISLTYDPVVAPIRGRAGNKYRIRVNGKWYCKVCYKMCGGKKRPAIEFYSKWEFRDMFMKAAGL